jgi:PAS domain S-box-containing protein
MTETLRALLESTPDVVVRLDRDLRCIYVNPQGERVLGVAADAWMGRAAGDVKLPEPQHSALMLTLRSVLRSPRAQTLELTVPTVRGEREFEARVVPEFDGAGEVEALLTVWRDITHTSRSEAERTMLQSEILRRQLELRDLLSQLVDARAFDFRVSAARTESNRLTARQQEILRMLAGGLSNREIATQLGLKTGTVKNHVATILTKLDVSDRIQAAVRAAELGIVEPDGS